LILSALLLPLCLTAGCVATGPEASLEIRLASDDPLPDFMPVQVASTHEVIHLSPVVELTDADVSDAEVLRTARGPAVGVKFGWFAGRKLTKIMTKYRGYRLAIIQDEKILAAPYIKGPPEDRRIIIVSDFTPDEARYLAAALSGRAEDDPKLNPGKK
jgi:preprotein translocase subunit SecD